MDISGYELKILAQCAGSEQPSPWGAAVSEALEQLKGSGYINKNHIPTEKGLEALKNKAERGNESSHQP